MNAPTFDDYSSQCPVCRRSGNIKPAKSLTGLLTCKHCQERLVVSWSGHYVRDPFRFQRLKGVERMLRRESHPFYRILRDSGLNRPNFLVAFLAGTLLFGVVGALAEVLPTMQQPSVQPRSLNHSQPDQPN